MPQYNNGLNRSDQVMLGCMHFVVMIALYIGLLMLAFLVVGPLLDAGATAAVQWIDLHAPWMHLSDALFTIGLGIIGMAIVAVSCSLFYMPGEYYHGKSSNKASESLNKSRKLQSQRSLWRIWQ